MKTFRFIKLTVLLLTGLLLQTGFTQTTRTVGTGGNYTTLKSAFDAINAGSINGAITLQIIGSTTESASAVLNASGTGSAIYSSINIYPTGTGYVISGSFASHLIDLNGADNVTFDGRVNATGSTKDLTISNSNNQSSSAIRFLNSAGNNTVKYCFVKSSETSTSRGIIFFSTSEDGNGNNNNLIDRNDITNAGGRVNIAIYSSGSAGRENSGNTISNNNIYDVWRTNANSYNIQLGSYSTEWTISGNSFYETTSFVPEGNFTFNPIKISNTSGVGFVITDNYIGGQAPLCGGSAMNVSASTSHLFQGITLTVGTSTASSIQNNTIKNINFTGSATSLWQGIFISAGAVNVGTVTGNTIGASTGTGSILVTGNVTSTVVTGINFTGNGVVVIKNNIIGSITAGNSNSEYATSVYAISRTNTGISTIGNNLIGSTVTENSIQATSTSTANDQSIFGIRNTTGGTTIANGNTIANLTNFTTNINSGTYGITNGISSNYGTITITNNTIYNLKNSNNNTASSNAASVSGIAVASTNALNTISGNTIYGLSNTYESFTGTVIGLYFGSTGMYTYTSHTVTENFIHSLSITGTSATTASIYGIKINTGQTTYANNIISIGGNTPNTIYGIYEYGTQYNNNSIYFNTIYIGGSLEAGVTKKSYALYSNVATNTRNIRNNIFVNARSTEAGSNLHYAVYFNYSVNTSLTLNYNDYYVSGTGGVLGHYSNTNKTSLPIVTDQDANSLNINPNFNLAGGTLPENYYSSATLPGITGTIITTDYAGVTRGATPKMGAFESGTGTYTWQGNTSEDYGTASNWVGGVVPPDGSNIEFAITPAHNCVLDQNRTIKNITNAQSTYKLNLNGHQLTITGSINLSNNAKIDASSSTSVVVFASTSAQSIPSDSFVSNIVDGLTINNSIGVTLNNDLTVQQGLTLTNGAFSIGAYTLTLNGAVTIASGTLTGGSSTNISFGGSGSSTSLPAITLNNLTLNRTNGISLGGNVSVAGTLALTAGTLTLDANTLTITGNSITKTNGSIDASNASATIIFANASAITLPASVFTGNVNNLTINGAGGITASSDFTVNGVLNLQSTNPSATKGSLDLWDGSAMKTLNMGEDATTIGLGDVTGIVARTSTFVANKPYTFGNEFTTITFASGGTYPTQLQSKTTIGTSPSWKPGAIKRINDFIRTGGTGCFISVASHYLDEELNGNNEEKLVRWKFTPPSTVVEVGRSDHSTTNNWVTNANIAIANFPLTFGSERTLANSELVALIWNGSVSNVWVTQENWTPRSSPSNLSAVIIPDASTTPNDPTLPGITETEIKSLTIEAGGILNSAAGAELMINGDNESWTNAGGVFNAGTGTVIFTNAAVTISGVTDFFNLTINSGAGLTMGDGCMMRIGGTLTNNGTWNVATLMHNVVEYNGENQTILNPNGLTSGYYNLILSGNGTKTMPGTALNILGNFIISGTASVSAGSELNIEGNATIGEGSAFSTGNFNHTIGGNFENNGTFNSATSYSISMNSDAGRYISGMSPISFKNLNVNNPQGITVYANVSIANTLTITSGNLYLGGSGNVLNKIYNAKLKQDKDSKTNFKNRFLEESIISISGDLNFSQNSKIDAKSTTSTIEFNGSSAQTVPEGAFIDNTVNNIKINNANGVTLYSDLTINGTLTLTNGILNTGTKTVTFSTLATDPVETSASRIVGTVKAQTIYTGTGSFSFLNCFIAAGTDDLGYLTVTRKTGPLGVITFNGNNSIQCNWDITPDYEPSNGRTVQYSWLSDYDNGKTFTTINKAVNYCSTDNGTSWSVHGDPVDVSASNPRVMSFITTHFSYWVSSDQNSPLPVTLSSFTSNINGRNAKLDWSTSSEISNSGFEIFRSNLSDSLNWIKIGFIKGNGTVNNSSNYSFDDRNLNTGKYKYKLKQIDYNGNIQYFNLSASVEIGVPSKFNLSQNYPNPFNPTTKIDFDLPMDSKVSIKIYDVLGKEIKTIVNDFRTAGYYTVTFDASSFSSGVYFYRIITDGNSKFIMTKKLVVLK